MSEIRSGGSNGDARLLPAGVREVLAAYRLGSVLRVCDGGGTAGKTWRIEAESGAYFLRRRGARTSSEAHLRFDHGLRDHLLACGVPTAAALRAADGSRWQRCADGVYELYPWVAGAAFDPGRVAQIAAAGRALARYHRAAAQYSAEQRPARIAQYTALGISAATSSRMDDPALLAATLRAVARLAPDAAGRALVDRCLARVERLQAEYAGEAYEALAGWVIHGDYTPANVLFGADDQVAGIFDLDWAVPGARCRDVADGMYFFGAAPRPIDAGSIWSLTDAAVFDGERCRTFLAAYSQECALTRRELLAIPAAFAGRWLSIRAEGMAKVAPAARFQFFSRDLEAPMVWLDAHWETLRRSL